MRIGLGTRINKISKVIDDASRGSVLVITLADYNKMSDSNKAKFDVVIINDLPPRTPPGNAKGSDED